MSEDDIVYYDPVSATGDIKIEDAGHVRRQVIQFNREGQLGVTSAQLLELVCLRLGAYRSAPLGPNDVYSAEAIKHIEAAIEYLKLMKGGNLP